MKNPFSFSFPFPFPFPFATPGFPNINRQPYAPVPRLLTHLLAVLLPALMLTSCGMFGSDEKPDPAADLLELAQKTSGNYTLTVLVERSIEVGYNPLFLDLRRNNGDRIDWALITIRPVMVMTSHTHSSPVWQPESTRNDLYRLFTGAFVATMPTGDMGTWRLDIDVTEPQTGDIVSFSVDVTAEQTSNVKVFTASNDERYILTWIGPESPKVGSNELLVSLHRRESMMSFPPVNDLTLEILPWMESMDHGSSNNVHPVSTGSGFYKGQVNFNMSGDWRVYFTLKNGQDDLHETWFDLMLN
jgi:hypothetical protein